MDGYAVADRYGCCAPYSGSATSSYVKGYTVTADYGTGTVSRIALNWESAMWVIFEGNAHPPTLACEDTRTQRPRSVGLVVLIPIGVVAAAGTCRRRADE